MKKSIMLTRSAQLMEITCVSFALFLAFYIIVHVAVCECHNSHQYNAQLILSGYLLPQYLHRILLLMSEVGKKLSNIGGLSTLCRHSQVDMTRLEMSRPAAVTLQRSGEGHMYHFMLCNSVNLAAFTITSREKAKTNNAKSTQYEGEDSNCPHMCFPHNDWATWSSKFCHIISINVSYNIV